MDLFTITLLLLCSFTRDTLASPVLNGRNASFSLPAIPRRVDYKLRKRAIGSVSANLADIYVYHEFMYTSPVTIGGNNGQNLNLHFDTGSTLPWLFGVDLPAAIKVNHRVFDPSLSPTWKDLGVTFQQEYTDGESASGELGSDSWNVGGIFVPTQAFGVADTVSAGSIDEPLDGILGLSYAGTLPNSKLNSFVNNLIPALDSPVFAAWLPQNSYGVFDFGSIVEYRYDDNILYAPVSDPGGLWKVTSTQYKVNGVSYPSPDVTAVIDSGIELILVQSTQVTQYYDAVPNSRYADEYKSYVFPCGQELPSISFLIGPDNFATVPGENLATGWKSDDGAWCLGGVQKEGSDTKFGFADILLPDLLIEPE